MRTLRRPSRPNSIREDHASRHEGPTRSQAPPVAESPGDRAAQRGRQEAGRAPVRHRRRPQDLGLDQREGRYGLAGTRAARYVRQHRGRTRLRCGPEEDDEPRRRRRRDARQLRGQERGPVEERLANGCGLHRSSRGATEAGATCGPPRRATTLAASAQGNNRVNPHRVRSSAMRLLIRWSKARILQRPPILPRPSARVTLT